MHFQVFSNWNSVFDCWKDSCNGRFRHPSYTGGIIFPDCVDRPIDTRNTYTSCFIFYMYTEKSLQIHLRHSTSNGNCIWNIKQVILFNSPVKLAAVSIEMFSVYVQLYILCRKIEMMNCRITTVYFNCIFEKRPIIVFLFDSGSHQYHVWWYPLLFKNILRKLRLRASTWELKLPIV